MRDINFSNDDILSGGLLGNGSSGSVFKVFYKREKMAMKKFHHGMKIPDTIPLKISEMCKDFDKFNNNLITPQYIIDNKEKDRYLMELVYGRNLSKFYDLSFEKKIEILKKAKNLVCEMNDKGIVHGDLYFGNFMYNKEKDDIYILDFDACKYGDYELEGEIINDLSYTYIHYNSADYGVDRFMFNIMTFAFLNNKTTYSARVDMVKENYGIFDFSDARKICDLIAEFYRCDDFLIDVIDEKKVRQRLDMK